MTAKGVLNFVILFEDEIRIAAKAVNQVNELPNGTTDEEFSAAMLNAFRACFTALQQADCDDSALMLSRKPIAPNAIVSGLPRKGETE